jgi:type I restriction enzyme S subunit
MEQREMNGTFRRLKPYPAYKDSGVEWLGEIPAHWEVTRLKHLARIASGFAPPERYDRSTGEYPVYGSNGLIGYCDEYLVSQETLAVGRVGASGSVNVVPAQSWVSDNALLLQGLRPRARLPWLRYVLETMNLGTQAAKNAQPIITGTFLGNQALATPSEEEQRAIAAFLDRETGKIDALVAKKERLIELLQEKRTALITRAVTKGLPAAAAAQAGLDPNVPMKDSGVEWLGEIPAHWEVLPFKRLFRLIYRYPTYYDIEYVPDGIPEIRGEALGPDGRILELEDQRFISPELSRQFSKTVLSAGDVVMSVRGTMGKVGFVEERFVGANITANLIRLSPYATVVHGTFLVLLIGSRYFQQQLDRQAPQTTIKTITVPQLAVIPVAVPPLQEQHGIVAELRHRLSLLDSLMARAREGIERLSEYRTSLISATVSGKIDVREEAI